MSLSNITRHSCSPNIGSITNFYFVPLSDVSQMPYVFKLKLLNSVALITGKTWFNGKVAHNSGSFIEDTVPSVQGTLWKWSITGTIHKDVYEKALNLYLMDNLPVIIQCVDSNGVRRLLGDNHHPLLLNYKHTTGPQYPGTNARSIEIKGEAPHPAYYYPSSIALPLTFEDPLEPGE